MSPENTNSNDWGSLLPVEVWCRVFHFVRWESYKTLLSLNICCRQFHSILSPELFKNIHIRCPRLEPVGPSRLLALLDHDLGRNIYALVRTLTVSSRPAKEEHKILRRRRYGCVEPDEPSELVYELVEILPNLEILRWRGLSFPPRLFSNLQRRHPAPSFYYEGGISQVINSDSLMGAAYLRSLSITSRLETLSDRQIDINALGTLIMTLPNLQRLILKHYFRNPFGGRGVSRPIFDLPPGSSLPPLEIISLANFSLNPEQAADWARCLAQRDVRCLGLDGTADALSPFIDCISGSIHTLSSLIVRISDSTESAISPHLNDSLDRLLGQNFALTSFAAYDLSTDVLRSAIRYHGGHLRCLQFRRMRDGRLPGFGFRNIDAGRYYSPTAVYWDDDCLFSPDDLRDLAYQLPAVERLGVDLSFKFKMASYPSEKQELD